VRELVDHVITIQRQIPEGLGETVHDGADPKRTWKAVHEGALTVLREPGVLERTMRGIGGNEVPVEMALIPVFQFGVFSDSDLGFFNSPNLDFRGRIHTDCDLYVGGSEHAVLHLLYARFWHKFLFDEGYVSTTEPFTRLISVGLIQAEDGRKMSKRFGNVINPDDIVKTYGADTLRVYEMFMGPLEAAKPWSMQGVNGVFGFLNRVWRLIMDERADAMQLNPAVVDREPNADENRVLHQTIQAVTEDIRNLAFNTAISRMMEFTNHFTTASERPREALEKLVLLLSPFAPHIAEELWQALGHEQSLAYEPWPEFDPALAKEDTVEVPVQINGKLRSKITVASDADKAQLESAARADEKVRENIDAVVVQGHTDERGSVAFNRDLSAKRANAVLNYLFEANKTLEQSYGSYFASSAYSKFRPVNPAKTEAAYEQNRRIEIAVVLKDSNVRHVIDDYMQNLDPTPAPPP